MKKHHHLLRLLILVIIGILVFVIGLHTGLVQTLPKFALNSQAFINGLLILILLLISEALASFVLGLIKPANNRGKTLLALTKNIIRYAVIIASICIILTMFNVDVVTILAGLGIVALIIGFGAESLIADVVTGMFILIDNQYNIGDIIEVAGFRGTVTDISVRTTVLTDPGGNVKIINNSDMTNILNRSDNSSRALADFPIPYETDLEALEAKIPELLKSIYNLRSELYKDVPLYLGVDQLGDSSVVLKFVVEVAESDIYAGARMLNHDLLIGMRHLGIEVPFPQMDIHQK
ncbi:MAG: mechanosensitive ion channel family protein [Clostridia bacterium]|nr:mechanosensitive ion channel family protein [Clostridia bacterium]